MKLVEKFQEVHLEPTKDGEKETLDRMLGGLFRVVVGEEDGVRLILVPTLQAGMSSRPIEEREIPDLFQGPNPVLGAKRS
jgi:hypothetical protein